MQKLKENLIRYVVHPLWSRKDKNYPYNYLKEYEKTQYLSADR